MSGERVVRVTVRLKPGVLDPAGEAIQQALRHLGFDGVSEVRAGKVFELTVAPGVSEDAIKKMAGDLLANTVIEDYEVQVP